MGRVIEGRYLITRRIARGAAARVYEAESLGIHREFAIKVVDFGPEAKAPSPAIVRARLRREIDALSQLRDPHIVGIVEVLQLSETCAAVVMDYIGAPTLCELIRDNGALCWVRACRLLRQIARASYAAHRAGWVHRDLKPANIMVEHLAGGDEFIHLIDFGIVWAEDGLTLTQGFVGTPLYASPEQARGAAIDPRSDIYSLGVILFEMLVGRPPFEHSKVKEVLRMHVRNPAPALRERAPERYFPPKLCALSERILQKDPAKRPGDMLQLIEELDLILGASTNSRRAPHKAPLIPRPQDIISEAMLPKITPALTGRAGTNAPPPGQTYMGHGLLEIFAPPDSFRSAGSVLF